MIKFIDAILKIDPKAEVTFLGEDIDSLKWDSTPIPKDTILAKQAEMQTEYDKKKYQRDRKVEYPDIGDQLDYIFHHGVEKWKEDMIIPVKNKYPKE